MISREQLAQFRQLLRPLRARIANTVARGVVQAVNSAAKMQIIQMGAQEGEDIDDVERFQDYGFHSVPHDGAEVVAVFPNGDRGHPIAVAVDDRRYRPTDWEEGDAGLFNSAGAAVKLKANGDIEVNPGSGGVVYTRSDGGTAKKLVTEDDFLNHTHLTAPTGAAVPPSPIAGAFVYTSKLQSE